MCRVQVRFKGVPAARGLLARSRPFRVWGLGSGD